MTADNMEPQEMDESGLPGPGAPTPLSALEGLAGLTSRDIKLFVDAGYNTVESIAYTYVSRHTFLSATAARFLSRPSPMDNN